MNSEINHTMSFSVLPGRGKCRQGRKGGRMKTRRYALLSVLIFGVSVADAQYWSGYWGERVLEKGFEQTDFFFSPSYVMPYGIGNFSATMPGLVRDPLMDLVINPARLALDSARSYLYTDFRSAKTIVEESGGVYPLLDRAAMSSVDMIYRYPAYFLRTRKELEPVFSGAYIGQPALLPGLTVGATYQLVMHDDKYYSIPQDIYRTTAGLDYNGREAAASSSMPIVDKYSGEDNIGQLGHFFSVFGRYALPSGFDLGLRLGRVFFTRDGAWGSSNLWEDAYYSSGSKSLWSNMETREQSYNHWDLAGGIEYHASDVTTLGLSVGHLWGVAAQSLRNNDSSYYSYSGSSTSFYDRSARKLQEWEHRGRLTSLGVQMVTRTSPTTTFSLLYRRQWSNVDINVGSTILDTSFSTYSYTYEGTSYASDSRSFLSDARGGGGDQVGTSDRVMAALQWDLDEHVSLSLGAQLEFQDREINTSEAVEIASRSRYWSTYSSGSYDWRFARDESKDLLWTFRAKRTSFRVPVFVDIKASAKVGILLGLCRDMTQWKIDDVTLALFRHRVSDDNGTVKTETNFGERYTEPTEEVTDVRTTFLAGLTISPSSRFQVRLLAVPNFRVVYEGSELDEWQWWVGLTVRP
jgi:hypothetical protein